MIASAGERSALSTSRGWFAGTNRKLRGNNGCGVVPWLDMMRYTSPRIGQRILSPAKITNKPIASIRHPNTIIWRIGINPVE